MLLSNRKQSAKIIKCYVIGDELLYTKTGSVARAF